MCCLCVLCCFFFYQAEDGIRDLVRSRGLGDVYKRQALWGRCEGAQQRLDASALILGRDITRAGGRFPGKIGFARVAVPDLSLIHI